MGSDITRRAAAVTSIINIYKESGRVVSNVKNGGGKKILTPKGKESIKEILDNDCSKTLGQIQKVLSESEALNVSLSTINRPIDDFKYTFKRVVLISEARNTENNIQKRYEYARFVITKNVDDLILIDEMGVNWSMRERYGRSLTGTSQEKPLLPCDLRIFRFLQQFVGKVYYILRFPKDHSIPNYLSNL